VVRFWQVKGKGWSKEEALASKTKKQDTMDAVKTETSHFLASNIRVLRKRLGLSQEELAHRVGGLNRGNIASYEKGTAEPKLCNLLRLAGFFNVSILDLTQRDLSDETAYQQALSNGQAAGAPQMVPELESFVKRAQEIKEVLKGLHCYHCFKMKNLAEQPRDLQIIVVNFEKLFEVTQVLLDSHEELLQLIQEKCRQHHASSNGSA